MGCDDYYETAADRARYKEFRDSHDAGFGIARAERHTYVCRNCSTVCEDWRIHLEYCPNRSV